MLFGIEGGRNDPRLKNTACPRCGARGRFIYHSCYRRSLLCCGKGTAAFVRTLVIDRVRCASCKATHACLPSDAVARSSLSVHLCLAALASTQTVEATCKILAISARTYYRIASRSARLLMASGVPVAPGSARVAASRLTRCHFCRTAFSHAHAGMFRATPFQNIRLPQSRPSGACGDGPSP